MRSIKAIIGPELNRNKVILLVLAVGIVMSLTLLSCSGGVKAEQSTGQSQAHTETKPEKPEFMLGGVQMNEGDQYNWIKNLITSGMNTVEVTVYAQQGRWFDNNLWFGEVNLGTLEEIRLAKKAGLKVVLILRLQMDHAFPENDFLWHGMVFPEGDYMLNRWFDNYGRFARQWAKVAEEEGVDALVIGSEMNALFSTHFIEELPETEEYYLNKNKQQRYREKVTRLGKDRLTSKYLGVFGRENYSNPYDYVTDRSEANRAWAEKVTYADTSERIMSMNIRRAVQNFYWEKLIWGLQEVYHGKLTIAANFDNYRQVKFWPELDYIGINAYFPLRKLDEDSLSLEEQLEEGWREVLDEILYFRDTMGITWLPVLFTELGYTEYSGAALAPWQGAGFSLVESPGKDSLIIWDQQPKDMSERNAAVRALYKVVQEKNFPLAGILYWKFTSWEHQQKEDPFALHIGPNSKDTLQSILSNFTQPEKGQN